MKVMVTGGCGYIGSHAAYTLLEKDHDVIILDDLSTGFRALAPATAVFVQGDIADRGLLQSIFREHDIDAIMHFAASVVLPESVAHPLKYYHNNTGKTLILIDEAIRAGIKSFLFSSTSAVYDHHEDAPIPKTHTLNPLSPYGRSKMMVEMVLEDAAKAHDFAYGALRYFNAAGADPALRTGQSGHATHLIKVACQTALGQRSHLDIYGTDYPTRDGTCIRDYIHVSDLAAAHSAAIDYLSEKRRSFVMNCGYGRGFTVREVVDAVKALSGVDFPVREIPRRDGDRAILIADSAKIRKELNWRPQHDTLDTIIRTSFAWEKKLKSLSLTNAT